MQTPQYSDDTPQPLCTSERSTTTTPNSLPFRLYIVLALMLALLLMLSACAGSGDGLDEQGNPIIDDPMLPEEPMPPEPPPMAIPTFSDIQATIFVPFCTCHVGASAPVGLVLNTDATYDMLVDVSSQQVPELLRVEPGNADDSYLIRKLEGGPDIFGAQMPRGGPPLPQDTIDDVRAWIDAGALDD